MLPGHMQTRCPCCGPSNAPNISQKLHFVLLHLFSPSLMSPIFLQGIAGAVELDHVYVMLIGILVQSNSTIASNTLPATETSLLAYIGAVAPRSDYICICLAAACRAPWQSSTCQSFSTNSLDSLRARLQAVCCQIMSIPGSLLQTSPGDESGRTWEYPRTAFTYMARDQRTARGVIEMEAVLTQQVCWPNCAENSCNRPYLCVTIVAFAAAP